MRALEAVVWVTSGCIYLRKSQTKTLADLVATAMRVGRVSLSETGRLLTEKSHGAAKHAIKRVWRFMSNDRVHVSDAMQGPLRWLFRSRSWRSLPLIVTLNWTEVRKFHTLMAAAVIRGRGVPLLWASYEEWKIPKSQNNLEEGLLRLLKSLLPPGMQVIVVADRGFGRTELARACQQLGFHYVIRIKPDVHMKRRRYTGKLSHLPVERGVKLLLKEVEFRKHNPVIQHVPVCWKKNSPKHRDECWFLMTDLAYRVPRLTDLYGRRMTIEELFRDQKNRRHGWALQNTQLTRPERFDRLLLILTLVYLLLVGVGLLALATHSPATWCSSNRAEACGLIFIGRKMIIRLEVPANQALRALINALKSEARKWG